MRARRSLGLLLTAGALLVAVVALCERWVLARLAGTPDPDAGRDFTFPARSIQSIPTPDGGVLHVEECGEGPPIVLLHGHGATMGTFALLALGKSGCSDSTAIYRRRRTGRARPPDLGA